jgi:hypothetical protein
MIRSSRSYPRGTTPLGLFALALAVVALTSAAPGPVTSTRHSPGWYPNADPESASVRLGRRPDAPLVSVPFSGGARSLDELGRTVCRLLHHRDQDSLLTLCVTDTEFRTILWREFPQSRPATGLQWEDGWRVLDMRLRSGISDAVGEYGGRVHTFVRFESPDSVARYRNFRLLSGLVLVVRDDEGRLQRWGWLRAVAERKGRYKLYSLRD